MGYAQVRAVGLTGLAGHLVTVEAHVAGGLPAMVISGLPDTALSEARDRVRAAIVNSGAPVPQRRVTVNLLPAELPKRGSAFDLAVAVVVLAAGGTIPERALAATTLIGELGLDGRVRPVRGVLPMVLAAAHAGAQRLIVPADNAAEASLVPGVMVKGAETLHQVLAFAQGECQLGDPPARSGEVAFSGPDLGDVVGQERGRFALELAAAGRHHLALFGPPGAGKTMLAQRLPSILPPLGDAGSLEVTALHSLAGALPAIPRLIRTPPFQAPHHTASAPALVGGGSGLARPGAVSLAHLGVLFLDEAPEFGPSALNALRQPLEDGWVTLMRSQGTTRYPANVQLVLAANPCPCANTNTAICECSPLARRRYLGRLSGPLLDRIDLQVTLNAVRAADLLGEARAPETSARVLERVLTARAVAAERWRHLGYAVNADVPGKVLRCPPFRLPRAATAGLAERLDRGTLSARGYDRVLRIAWSIVDIDGRERPTKDDVDEALQLRTGEGP